MSELLMKLQSNMILAADIRPSVLYLYDDKLCYFGNVGVLGGQEMSLNYDQVAQVNQHRGLIEGSLEIINSGGRNTILISHVTNSEAERAKTIIEQRANLARAGSGPTPPLPPGVNSDPAGTTSAPNGIGLLNDLARLRDQGILTDEE